jgi:hypothetical protein
MGKPDNKILTTNWKIHEKPKQTVEIVDSLSEALKSRDVYTVQKILQDPENLRSMVERRGAVENHGEDSKSHKHFQESFDLLFKEKFGEVDIYHVNESEVVDFIHEYQLPEQILAEYLDIAYHKRDEVLFNRLKSIILENKEKFKNQSIIPRYYHNLATWQTMIEKNEEKAKDSQREAKIGAIATKDEVLDKKTNYPRPGLKAKDRIEGYNKTIAGMEALDHRYDAMRARVDEALARVELAHRQKGTKQFELRTEHLDIAKKLALTAYDYSLAQDIPNLEVMALEALSKIHDEMGEMRSARQYREKADSAHDKYKYLTRRI